MENPRLPSPWRRVAACVLAAAAAAALPAAADGPAPTAEAAARLLHEAALALAPADARLEIVPGELDPRLRLSPCTRIEPFVPAGSRPWGRTRVGLRCLEGERPWTVYLPVTVKVLAPALIMRTALPAGAVLQEAHLATAEVDWAAANSPVLTDAAGLVGRTLARGLVPGDPVRSADLRERRWFSAGDTVRLVASGRGFSVSGEAQALSDGLEGRTVRVRTDSGRVLSGLATGERRVEVGL